MDCIECADSPAVLDADDLAGSVLTDVGAEEVPFKLKGCTTEDVSNWRAGPHHQLRCRNVVRALQVATYIGKGVDGFAQLAASRMHDAQQALAFEPADSAASKVVDQMTGALLAQHSDVRLEVLRRHPAVLSADSFVDPEFFVANQHIFGAAVVLHELARHHSGNLKVSASDSAIAAALSLHLSDLPALQQLSCEGEAFNRQNQVMVNNNGAAILQAVAVAKHVTMLELHGKCWAASEACKAALARCSHLRQLHVQVPNTQLDERGCLNAIECMTQLTSLRLGSMHWVNQPIRSQIHAQQHLNLRLKLPQLQVLDAHAIPAPDSQLPALRSIRHICNPYTIDWHYRAELAPGVAGNAEQADARVVSVALCSQLTAVELVVHKTSNAATNFNDPSAASLTALQNLRSLIIRCPVRPDEYKDKHLCKVIETNRLVQAYRVLHLTIHEDGGDEEEPTGWIADLGEALAELPNLTRFEHHIDNTLVSSAAAIYLAECIAEQNRIRVLMLPGVACMPQGDEASDTEGQDGGDGDNARIRQFQATLPVMHGADPDAGAPAEDLPAMQQHLNMCASLRQLAFVQPTGLECQRHMPGLRAGIEVHSVTQQQVWRGQLPQGWGDVAPVDSSSAED